MNIRLIALAFGATIAPAWGDMRQTVPLIHDTNHDVYTVTLDLLVHGRMAIDVDIDMESPYSYLSEFALKRMKILPTEKRTLMLRNGGKAEVSVYEIDVEIGKCRFPRVAFVGVTGPLGAIGNDILEKMKDVSVDRVRKELSFNCPQ